MATHTTIVDPNGGGDYLSLWAWEYGEQTKYPSGDIAIADCRRTGPAKDTTAVTLSGWTSGVIPKIIVNEGYRHEGKWADQREDGNYIYILEVDGFKPITNNIANTVIEGLLINSMNGPSNTNGITSSSATLVDKCIIKSTTPGSANRGVSFSNASSRVTNTVVYGFNGTSNVGIYLTAGAAYNCTVFGCTNGIYGGGTSAIIKNCFIGSCSACISGSFSTASGRNISSDGSASGLTYKTTYSSYFVDYLNGDFHLKGTTGNGGIFGATGLLGFDLSTTFTGDLDYQTRSVWDIGADEYVLEAWNITPSDLASSGTLGAISVEQHHILAPTGLNCAGAVGISLTQHNSLVAAGLASLSAIPAMTVSIAPNMFVDGLACVSTLGEPSVTQKHILAIDALSGASVLQVSDALMYPDPSDLTVPSHIGEVSLVQHHTLSPDSLQSLLEVSSVLYIVGADGVVDTIYALPRCFYSRALPRWFNLIACNRSNSAFSEFR